MIDINNIYIDIDVNYYIEEIKKDLANKQFISALAIALMLPNICAKLENPEIDKIHKEKYVKWFNRWVYRKYYSHPNNKEIRKSKVKNPNLFKIKIDGDLCYALRCSILHSGDDKIKIAEIWKKDDKEKVKRIKPNKIELCLNSNSELEYQYGDSTHIFGRLNDENQEVSIRFNIITFIDNIIKGTEDFLNSRSEKNYTLFKLIDWDKK